MRQSRLMSLVEAVANVVVGYGVAVLVQLLLFPLFGLTVTLRQNLVIGLVFTAVSIVRSYLLRRAFDAWRWMREASSSAQSEPHIRRMARPLCADCVEKVRFREVPFFARRRESCIFRAGHFTACGGA